MSEFELCNLNRALNNRLENGKTKLSYGVKFLDKATGGIRRNDLVVIGGRTGGGKSELASIIAQNNCKNGLRVCYFALEAEEDEVVNRMLYRVFSRLYYKDYYNIKTFKAINYVSFMDGEYDREYEKLMRIAENDFENLYPNLLVFYRDKKFGLDQFKKQIWDMKDSGDLFILDHLHHFDFDSSQNEIMQIKSAVKMLRDICLIIKKPIICIAHLRKGDRASRSLVPDLEEFYGSSEISKEATQVITIAPYEDDMDIEPYKYPTLFKVCKFRKNGGVAKFVGLHEFNTRDNKYNGDFILGKLEKSGTVFTSISSNKPYWAFDKDETEDYSYEEET